MVSVRTHTALLVVVALWWTPGLAAEQTPASVSDLSADELDHGKRLFNAHCAICHSIGGTGGRGPDLTFQPFRRAKTDRELVRAIQFGIPGTEMPASWMINHTEARRIAGYVRSLGEAARIPVPGDVARGATIYSAADCSQCHIVAGSGRGLGPELSAIGARRSAEHLRRALGRPGADVDPAFAAVQLEKADGQRLTALRVNEDSFTLQVCDLDGGFISLRKSDLKSSRLLRGESLMPDYATQFTPDELDDLVAYLVSLKGEEQ